MKLAARAPAKVNWTLEVLGRRSDGYHEIRTILQTVDLWDTLSMEAADSLPLGYQGDCPAPAAEDLVLRAAQSLQGATGCRAGARLHLRKVIAVAAGLGGGSSDAAAVLRGLNHLWQVDLRREELAVVGAQLGSDVPFFVYGGTALAEGRGERITPLPDVARTWLVLLVPPLTLPAKTAAMYGRLRTEDYSDGRATSRLVEELRRGSVPRDDLLSNVFAGAALAAYPGLGRYWQALAMASGRRVHLAGSGPAIFALAADE
ncbi:MAG: 4-(cytidine 5'-diphospho)-2-C-methyl-D-erythritol kinase, partial [Dehalococcoidia bacterium]